VAPEPGKRAALAVLMRRNKVAAPATLIDLHAPPRHRKARAKPAPGPSKELSFVDLPEIGIKRTGTMLANARAAAGLELSDIARDTRVPLRHLKALEEDRHDELPALPYAIGFVKSFARAVGLDPETVAGQFRAETSKGAHVPSMGTLEPLDERRLPSQALVYGSVALVIAVIAGLSAWGAGAFDPPPPAAIETASAPPPAPAAVETAPAAVAVAAAGAPAPAIAASGPVVLTAREDVWLKVYDGATKTSVMTGTLAAGQSFSVPATPGLQLWTGKAGALDVTIGGRPIPPLGGPVETVKNISLAPADLLARQAAKEAGTAPAATEAAATASGLKPIATIPAPKPKPEAVMPPPATPPAGA
jgi:cytoskeleton protein RodZ